MGWPPSPAFQMSTKGGKWKVCGKRIQNKSIWEKGKCTIFFTSISNARQGSSMEGVYSKLYTLGGDCNIIIGVIWVTWAIGRPGWPGYRGLLLPSVENVMAYSLTHSLSKFVEMSTKIWECKIIRFYDCRYVTPMDAGYSTEFSEESLADHIYPTGRSAFIFTHSWYLAQTSFWKKCIFRKNHWLIFGTGNVHVKNL